MDRNGLLNGLNWTAKDEPDGGVALEPVTNRLSSPLTPHRLYFEVYRLGDRILETEEEAYNQGCLGELVW